MVRSTCLAVDAGLPDVLQTPRDGKRGRAGRRSARPAAPASLALRGGCRRMHLESARPVRWPSPRAGEASRARV